MKKNKYDASKQLTLDLPRTVQVRLEKIANGQPAFGEFELVGAVCWAKLEQSALSRGYRVIDWSYAD